MRNETKPFANAEVVRELRAIAERTSASRRLTSSVHACLTGQRAKVTITYCAECGYEPQTLALTEALMKTFTHQLTAIELVPWYEGSFDVAVDGKLVHSHVSRRRVPRAREDHRGGQGEARPKRPERAGWRTRPLSPAAD